VLANPRLLLPGSLSASAATGYLLGAGWRRLRQAPAAEAQVVMPPTSTF